MGDVSLIREKHICIVLLDLVGHTVDHSMVVSNFP